MESDKKTEPSAEPAGASLPLTMAEKQKLLQSYKTITSVGSYIDCQDTVKTWCVARIVAENEADDVRIHYDGWDNNRYGEVRNRSDTRLAPFRSHTKNYTGNKNNPTREIKLTAKGLQEISAQVSSIIGSNFDCLKTPHLVTQFLRGELYIFVDFLMTTTLNTETEVPKVIDFLKLVARLLALYFKWLANNISSLIEFWNNPAFYLVDQKVALAAASGEMYDLLSSLFCQVPRTYGFFVKYDVDLGSDFDPELKEFVALPPDTAFSKKRNPYYSIAIKERQLSGDEQPIHGAFILLFAIFAKFEGFDSILNLTSPSYLKLQPESLASDYRLSLELVLHYLLLFKSVTIIISHKYGLRLTQSLEVNFMRRLRMLNPREIKSEFNKEVIYKRLKELEPLLKLKVRNEVESATVDAGSGNSIISERVAELMENIELDIISKEIWCPSLELRLKGLADLSNIIDSSEARYLALEGKPKREESSREKLIKWITTNQIVDHMLDDDPHQELVLKMIPICRYVIKYSERHIESIIETLWRCQQNTHEDIVPVTYPLKEIAAYLKWPHARMILAKIKALEAGNQINEKLIDFMKEFSCAWFDAVVTSKDEPQKLESQNPAEHSTAVAMDTSSEEKKVQQQKNVEPDAEMRETCLRGENLLCVPILWRLIQEDSAFQKKDVCLKAMTMMMKTSYMKPYIPPYIFLCMENIASHKSVENSINLAKNLLKLFPRTPNSQGESAQEFLEKLNTKYPIISMILNSIEHFSKSSKPNTTTAKKEKQNIRLKLSFIATYLELMNNTVFFTKEYLLRLWKICMNQPATSVFIEWLTSISKLVSESNNFLGKEEDLLVFNLLSENFETLSVNFPKEYFECFSKYFHLGNLISGGMRIATDVTTHKTCDLDKIIGMEQVRGCIEISRKAKPAISHIKLWKAAIKCENSQERKEFTGLLVKTYKCLGAELIEKRCDIWKKFIHQCMKQFTSAASQAMYLVNVAEILLFFLERIEGRMYNAYLDKITEIAPAPKEAVIEDESIVELNVHYLNESRQMRIYLPDYIQMGQLRIYLSQKLKLPYCHTMLLYNKSPIDFEEDDCILRMMKIKGDIDVENMMGIGHSWKDIPTNVLANSDEYIGELFDILDNHPENGEVIEILWKILGFIPTNEKIKQDIQKLNLEAHSLETQTDNTSAWDRLLNSHSIHRLYYSLQIIDTLLSNPSSLNFEKPTEEQLKKEEMVNFWKASFREKLGLNHVFYCLLNMKNLTWQPLEKKVLGLMITVIMKAMPTESPFDKHIPFFRNNKDKIIERVIEIIDSIVTGTLDSQGSQSKSFVPAAESQDSYANTEILDEEPTNESKHGKEAEAVESGFRMILISRLPSNMLKRYKDIIKNGLILSRNQEIKNTISQEIHLMCLGQLCGENVKVFLPFLLSDLLEVAKTQSQRASTYFLLASSLIRRLSFPQLAQFDTPASDTFNIKRLCEQLIDIAISCKAIEGPVTALLEAVLSRFPNYKLSTGQYKNFLVHELLKELFDYQTADRKMIKDFDQVCLYSGLICSSKESRVAAFSLVCTISRDTKINIEQVVDFLIHYHKVCMWRLPDRWEITPPKKEKSHTGYVGLKNLSCICYMNSLFQQLYMIPEFRNIILSSEISPPSDFSQILAELQRLFTSLSLSVKQAYNPISFCRAFKGYDLEPINIYEQTDVDEFFNLLMDRLEKSYSVNPKYRALASLFSGTFNHQIISRGCPHSSSSDEPFIAINLQILNKKSLQQCLDCFIEGEEMKKSNAYHCDKCDKNVPALKKVLIKTLPPYLIFVLKRFTYDYGKGVKIKLNGLCEFPHEIDMAKYTVDSKSQIYKLRGLIIHRGTADSGHYYSIIHDRERVNLPDDNRWFKFNDHIVSFFDIAGISNEAFGGEETKYGVRHEKLRNAYMLIYEKAECWLSSSTELVTKLPFYEEVCQENAKHYQKKHAFGDEYLAFITNFANSWCAEQNMLLAGIPQNPAAALPTTERKYCAEKCVQIVKVTSEEMQCVKFKANPRSPEREGMELTVMKLLFTVFFTTTLRSLNTEEQANQADLLKTYINVNPQCAKEVIIQFTHPSIITEFFFECNVERSRKLTGDILNCALMSRYSYEISKLKSTRHWWEDENAVIPNFFNAVLAHLSDGRWYHIRSQEYFYLLYDFVKLGPDMHQYISELNAIPYLMACCHNDQEPNYQPAFMKEKFPYRETHNPLLLSLAVPSVVARSGKCCNSNNHEPRIDGLQLCLAELLGYHKESSKEAAPAYKLKP